MADTKIEYVDKTWNPVTGCTPVSDGCRNCWASRLVKRFPHLHGERAPWGTSPHREPILFSEIRFHPSRLDMPLRWKKPRRVLVCSMGDLFHEDVKRDWIDAVWSTIAEARQHTFMILTKRPERMQSYLSKKPTLGSHVWLGTSIENNEVAYPRMSALFQTLATNRYISVEPMLGPVDVVSAAGMAALDMDRLGEDLGPHWVICGCESGPGRRPCNIEWVRSLVQQCEVAGVPAFVKQVSINGRVSRVPMEWPEDIRIREWPK